MNETKSASSLPKLNTSKISDSISSLNSSRSSITGSANQRQQHQPSTSAPASAVATQSSSISNSNSRFQLQLIRNLQTSNLNLIDFLNPLLQYSELSITALTSTSSFSSLSSSSFALNPNLEVYFAHTLGSSFYNGSSTFALALTHAELKDLCSLIKKLFVKNLINQINKYLNDFLTSQQNEVFQLQQQQQLQPQDHQKLRSIQAHPYVYRSFSEVLSLCSITMFKDLLFAQQMPVSQSLSRELKELIEEFYRLELIVKARDSSRSNLNTALGGSKPADSSNNTSNITSPSAFINHHASRFKSKLMAPNSSSNNGNAALTVPLNNNSNNSSLLKSTSSTQWNSAKNSLIIAANAAAIELYFLCVEDELDAEKLCTKCSEKFFINLSLSETILQASLIASCIQVLGRLALKYPLLSKTSVKHLTDFLTEPSPILLKQYKHIIEKLTVKVGVNSKTGQNTATNSSNLTRFSGVKSSNTIGGQSSSQANRNIDSSVVIGSSKTLSLSNASKIFNSTILDQPNGGGGNSRSLSRSQTLAYKGGVENVSYSKSTRIFEFLRDLTIECLCL